jgi:hypothetical protein
MACFIPARRSRERIKAKSGGSLIRADFGNHLSSAATVSVLGISYFRNIYMILNNFILFLKCEQFYFA